MNGFYDSEGGWRGFGLPPHVREKMKEKDFKLPDLPDPNDSWAMVELYRWQHGCLPGCAEDEPKNRPLDIPLALESMAKPLEGNDTKAMPIPPNVASVLRFAAAQLRRKYRVYEEAVDDAISAAKSVCVEAPTSVQEEILSEVISALEKLKEQTPF